MASLFQTIRPHAVLLSGPRTHKRPLPTTTVYVAHTDQPRERRIAHWDTKRATCGNCQRIFLKTQSRVTGFCSVDCKSNAVYMATIHRRTDDATTFQQHVSHEEETDASAWASCVATFSAYGVEEREETECYRVQVSAASAP